MKIQKPNLQSQTPAITQQAQDIAPATGARRANPDLLVGSGQGAPAVLPRPESQSGSVGRPSTQQQVPTTGGFNPAPQGLSDPELERIAGVGGEGMKGRGTLQGKVDLINGKAYLVTANEGSKSAVRFALDIKNARELVGQSVSISGMIEKQSPWGGKITGADVVTGTSGPGAKFGDYVALKGTIQHRDIMAIGGEAPPSGPYLVLDQPVVIGGKSYKEVFVQSYGEPAQGDVLELHGRLDRYGFGGVETPASAVATLTGVSNLTKGEPRFIQGEFQNAQGETLTTLTDPRPSYYDAPAHQFVLDHGSDTVFLGRSGGHIPADKNPFHGFVGTAKVEPAAASDQGKVKFDSEGNATNASGEALFMVYDSGMASHPDAMSTRWFLDDQSKTIYAFNSGGFAGFNNHLSSVIRLPTE